MNEPEVFEMLKHMGEFSIVSFVSQGGGVAVYSHCGDEGRVFVPVSSFDDIRAVLVTYGKIK